MPLPKKIFALVLLLGVAGLIASLSRTPHSHGPLETGPRFLAEPSAEEQAFISFLAIHGKQYPSLQDYEKRMAIFSKNMRTIESHNANPKRKFSLGLGPFADLSFEEFKATYGQNLPKNDYYDDDELEGA